MLQCSLNQFLIKIEITTTIIYLQKNARISQLENNHKNCFHSIIMLRFRETKITKEMFYAVKKPVKNWDVNTENIVIKIS